MKKFIASVCLLLFVFVCFSASAEPTKRAGVFEFCELFTQRFEKMTSEYGIDLDLTVSRGISDPYESDGYLYASVTAGDVSILPTDYTIHDIIMMLYGNDSSADRIQLNCAKCTAAISALERNSSTDGDKIKFLQKDPIAQAINIWYNEMSHHFPEGSEMKKGLPKGVRVQLYSGNYNYYLTYDDFNGGYYYIVAEEHK